MNPSPLLWLALLAVREEPERGELVRRGYELLPNARWVEELERDRRGSVFGVPISTPRPMSGPRRFTFDLDALDYDPTTLHSEAISFAHDAIPPTISRPSKRERLIWALVTEAMKNLNLVRPSPLLKPLDAPK